MRDYQVAGQIGLEASPEAFIAEIVRAFREVGRVLHPSGTLFVNLGDSFGPNKQLLGIPWRVALALQADGWFLRSDIIWAKPNPRPESVKDRPTRSHEYLFLLTKSERYYFDAKAVRESDKGTDHPRKTIGGQPALEPSNGLRSPHRGIMTSSGRNGMGRNIRSVWSIPVEPYRGAHFATFPRKLVEPCIKAGCPVGGVVLDPFVGTGTTIVVANALGRRGIGVDMSREYLGLARQRITRPHARAPRPRRAEHYPLFERRSS
jgi:site-specific DNA-methyltransferase (adenine-specific)